MLQAEVGLIRRTMGKWQNELTVRIASFNFLLVRSQLETPTALSVVRSTRGLVATAVGSSDMVRKASGLRPFLLDDVPSRRLKY